MHIECRRWHRSKVNNLLDKTCHKKFGPTGIADYFYYYGDPRSVPVSLRANF